MKNIKILMFSLLALVAVVAIGWSSFALSGPSAAEESASGHAGHAHGHAENAKAAKAKGGDDHDVHDHGEHGRHEDDEDLEGLFAEEKGTSGGEHHDDHGHDEHAGEPASRSGNETGHAGHEHAGHRHGDASDENCPEHNVPEVVDALCNPEGVAMLRPGEGMKVRLASPQVAERVGIATTSPLPAEEAGGSWPGQVVFNRDRLARLAALSSGTVLKVRAGLGEQVRAGAVLAEIAAPEAAGLRGERATAESRRDLAATVFQREKDLFEKGISSRQEYQQAEAELRQAESAVVQARQQAEAIGLHGNGSILTIRAPFAGVVVERMAVVGEAVAPGTPLYTVADLSSLWVEISAPEDALLTMRPGLGVKVSFAGLPGRTFPGKIFWVAPALDERTRMLRAIAEIDNRDGLLKSGLFGDVRPAGRNPAANALAVPADALQSVDGQPFVFVRLEEDLFELRRVAAGRKANGVVTIAAGLSPRDQVVSTQAFALKSEVLRARLGASCADH